MASAMPTLVPALMVALTRPRSLDGTTRETASAIAGEERPVLIPQISTPKASSNAEGARAIMINPIPAKAAAAIPARRTPRCCVTQGAARMAKTKLRNGKAPITPAMLEEIDSSSRIAGRNRPNTKRASP